MSNEKLYELEIKLINCTCQKNSEKGLWSLSKADFKEILDNWPEKSCGILHMTIMGQAVYRVDADETTLDVAEGFKRERHASFRNAMCEMLKEHIRKNDGEDPHKTCEWVLTKEDAVMAAEIMNKTIVTRLVGMVVLSTDAKETKLIKKGDRHE